MQLFKQWRDLRTTGLRSAYAAAIARVPCPNAPARTEFLATIAETHGTLLGLCTSASPAVRRAILRYAKKAANELWQRGAWPKGVGWDIAVLNVASRFEVGDDAAYVRAQTAPLLNEALQRNLLSRQAVWAAEAGASRRRGGRDLLRQLAREARQTKLTSIAEIAAQASQLTQARRLRAG